LGETAERTPLADELVEQRALGPEGFDFDQSPPDEWDAGA
jgi:hypothetical protein